MTPSNDTKSRIMDAAEQLFADASFDAVTVREIMTAADANLGLMKYYFKSKEALLEAVIARRAGTLNAARLERIRVFAGTEQSSIARVVDSIVDPYFEMMTRKDAGWHAYGRLIAQMAQQRRWNPMIHKYFDEISGHLIDELHRIADNPAREATIRAFVFAIGAELHFFSINGRLGSLSAGSICDDDLNSGVKYLKIFMTDGLAGCLNK